MALCFPSLKEVERFRVPLELGERHLLDFLLSYLDNNYEIYVQPFLHGDRPDIVVVRPDAGVLIIEVKDWNLKYYRNFKGGLASWELIKNNARIRSPMSQVETYKKNLYKLHDKLFQLNIRNALNYGLVKTAVYFHNEKTENARKFCFNLKHTQILGHDALNPQGFQAILGKAGLNCPSNFFDNDLYESFRRFLKPPEHTPDMGKDIRYTRKQEELVKSKANLRQKVRGVAGCGKTKVLAGRAVAAYARTRDVVLILTYNITLRNYIHDRISEVREHFPWSGFEITNYHQFFKNQANNYELESDDFLIASDQKDFFDSAKNRLRTYKTILVDEVQDYKNEWLRLLVEYFLAEDGEFVVFGDEKQNVYNRSMGNDKFPVTPIVGRWNELNESFRMGTATFNIAQAFQKAYFQEYYELDKNVEVMQGELFETPAKFRYYVKPQADSQEIFQIIRDETQSLSVHPNDLVVLAPTHEIIRSLEYHFRHDAHERTTHAGETEEEYKSLLKDYPDNDYQFQFKLKQIRHGRKLHFWGNSGTVKLSTIQSFKGWEAHTLILIISNTYSVEEQGSLNELIYTGLTRARKNLIIFDETGLYRDFFSRFIEE